MFDELDMNQYAVGITTHYLDNLLKKAKSIIHKYSLLNTKKGSSTFDEYYETVIKKYYRTKTLLFNSEPKQIIDFFVYPTLKIETNNFYNFQSDRYTNKKSKLKNMTIEDVFIPKSIQEFDNILIEMRNKNSRFSKKEDGFEVENKSLKTTFNCFLIHGIAGSGKSLLLKYLFLNCIENNYGFPLFFSLRDINQLDLSFEDFLLEDLKAKNLELSNQDFDNLLKKGDFVFFFDGIDEIKPKKFDKITSEIIKFCDKYYGNKFFMSSRPYQKLLAWNNFQLVGILPLNKASSLELINKLNSIQEVESDEFYNEVKQNLYEKNPDFLSNPLLLTMIYKLFSLNGLPPEEIIISYDDLFDTLYSGHDTSKDFYKRIFHTKLTKIEFRSIFSYLSFKSYFESKYEFKVNEFENYLESAKDFFNIEFNTNDIIFDFNTSLSLIIEDGLKLTYAHLSFQEFYAAKFIIEIYGVHRDSFIIDLLNNFEFSSMQNIFLLMHNLNRFFIESILLDSFTNKIEEVEFNENMFLNLNVNNEYFKNNNQLIIENINKIYNNIFNKEMQNSIKYNVIKIYETTNISIKNISPDNEKYFMLLKLIEYFRFLKLDIYYCNNNYSKFKSNINEIFNDNLIFYKFELLTKIFELYDIKDSIKLDTEQFKFIQLYLKDIYKTFIEPILETCFVTIKMKQQAQKRNDSLIQIKPRVNFKKNK